jgi:hypothetical protein
MWAAGQSALRAGFEPYDSRLFTVSKAARRNTPLQHVDVGFEGGT